MSPAPRLALATATFVAAGAGAAFAAPAAKRPLNGRIVLAQSIATVRLGMAAAPAQRILLRAGTPFVSRRVKTAPGVTFVQYEYRPHEIEGATYDLGLLGKPGHMRVVSIGTYLARHRTAQGVGVGTSQSALYRAYGRRLHCDDVYGGNGRFQGVGCLVGARNTRHTVFLFYGDVTTHPPVGRVVVREARLKIWPP